LCLTVGGHAGAYNELNIGDFAESCQCYYLEQGCLALVDGHFVGGMSLS